MNLTFRNMAGQKIAYTFLKWEETVQSEQDLTSHNSTQSSDDWPM